MANFECPTCHQECKRLISGPQSKSIQCELCYERPDIRPTYLHQMYPGSEAKGLTIAKAGVIGRRRISPDDKMTVIDYKSGKESEY